MSGTVSVNVIGGTVNKHVYGGSLGYGKVENVETTVSGAETNITRLLAGGAAPTSGNTPKTTYDDSWNAVKNVTISISDAILKEGFGCGGGFSYAYTGQSTVTATNAKLGSFYGVLANGYADNIEATLTNCTFYTSGVSYREFAAINRGKIKDASFSMNDCTFENATGISTVTYSLGAIEGWADSDTQGDPVPVVTGSVTFTFTGCTGTPDMVIGEGLENADVTLTGAKAILKKYRRGSKISQDKGGQTLASFTLGGGKTWTFNSGLELGTSENAATLTKNGTLVVKAADVTGLEAAVALQADSISLAAGEYKLSKSLVVKGKTALCGTFSESDSTKITYSDTFKDGTDNSSKHLVEVEAGDVSLKNLIVDGTGAGAKGSGIQLFQVTGGTLDNVISRNNPAAGMIVNGSAVKATNFRTENNAWYGVNVDKSAGSNVNGVPVFTIGAGCSFGETVAIKSDLTGVTETDFVPTDYVVSDEWTMLKRTEDTKTYYYWVNSVSSGIDYAIISVPATVVYGQANLPLISNAEDESNVSYSVAADNGVVEILSKGTGNDAAAYDSLKILKPGTVSIQLNVNDTVVNQTLEVLKRVITVSGITAANKTYDGTTAVTLDIENVVVEGYLGEGSPFTTYTGTLTDANAGDAVPINVTATWSSSDTNNETYYEIAYAAVTDTVKKADLTVKTNTINAIDFGTELPKFDVTETGFVNSETNTVLDGALKFDCPATTESLAGKYPVMPYGYTSDNYNIKYVADSLEIKAIKPTVELVSAVVSDDKKSAVLTGRVLSNGGTPLSGLTGGFKASAMGASDVMTTGLAVATDGTFTATLSNLPSAEVTFTANASAGNELVGDHCTGILADLTLLAQKITFVSNLSRLVYGSTAELAVKDHATGATIAYAVDGTDASSIISIENATVKALKPGTATIKATATLDGYITATAKQTVTVVPKNLTAKASGAITKAYDGGLEATVSGYTLEGLISGDEVTVSSDDIKAYYLDKNVGTNKPVVLSGDLTLGGTAATNYTLTQPTGLAGAITEGSNVEITVSEVKRKYNETALRYKLSFKVGDTELDPVNMTGKVVVAEGADGNYTVDISGTKFFNYGTVSSSASTGAVEIEKGTPKVLTYHSTDGGVAGKLLDAEGWTGLKVEVEDGTDGKKFASVTYNGTKAVGKRLAVLGSGTSLPDISWAMTKQEPVLQTRSMSLRATSDVQTMTYGDTWTLTPAEGFTYTPSNTGVVVLEKVLNEKVTSYTVKAVGVGTGAIVATHTTTGAVLYKEIQVTPKELELEAANTGKSYDGTTKATPALSIVGGQPAGVALDLTDISFNYAQNGVGTGLAITPTQPIVLSGAAAVNYCIKDPSLTGSITARELVVTNPISKYYDGTTNVAIAEYNATGLIAGEAAPTLKTTFADANVGINKVVTLTIAGNPNYTLATEGQPTTGSIAKSTIDASLTGITTASSEDNLKSQMNFSVRENGNATVAHATIG